METKHTPGPWKIAGEEADRQTFVYALNDRGSNRFWFDIQSGWTDDKQRTSNAELSANARLIAAAPELLECLIWAMEQGRLTYHARTKSNAAHCDAVDRARAVIAKATGKA